MVSNIPHRMSYIFRYQLVLKILLASLLFLSVTSQNEEGSGGDKDSNEEAWEYVEFLKTIR